MIKIIEKKRNGQKLSDEEIQYFVNSVSKTAKTDAENSKGIDRSQIGAMLMAIYLRGLDDDETIQFTLRMKNSGFVFSWPPEWKHLVVDKHSTGGVGDKISLVLAPALAAVGLKVPMISGRSLAHTGGTLDKLESIPNFRVDLTKEEIYRAIDCIGCCIVGQTSDIVPTDKILYQCREITATIDSHPLIIASIVSKKLCEGTEALVYDVKFGKGSFFSSKKEAEEMALSLVRSSKGVKASALLTSMDSPLGKAIGNSVEVIEAIDCLKGNGPSDVVKLTCALGSELLQSVGKTKREEGFSMILEAMKDGRALEKFHSMIIHQGVSAETAKELCYGNAHSVFTKAKNETDISYDGDDGYIQEIDALALANVWKEEFVSSDQNPGVGFVLLKVVGERIISGDAWIRVYHQCLKIPQETYQKLKNAITVAGSEKETVLISKRIFLTDESTVISENYF